MTSFISRFSGSVVNPADVSLSTITLTANLQLQWPINGDPDLTAIGRITVISATSAGLSIYLPPANQASVGEDVLIRNTGAETFTVKDYGGANTVITIAAGEAKYVYLTNNSTGTGTWGSFAFGTGTSSADAASLAGKGLEADASKLNQSLPVTLFSTNYTVADGDRAKFLVWTGGAGTLSLLAASTLGDNWFINVRNGGTGLLTVYCDGIDLFNGSGSVGMQPDDSCFIGCSGGAFYSIGLGKNTQFNFSQLLKTVSSGTYTLTNSEAANTMLKFVSSGDLTGNVTIIVPPTLQVYYVQNATTSPAGYTITISNPSGGSTAQITAGQQSTVMNDSVNIVNANTIVAGSSVSSLTDGTVTNPSLYFGTEATTGVYRPGAGKFGVAVLGVQVLEASAAMLTVVGGVTISGSARRILGDFSNATLTDMVMFQTSTANSSTTISAIPSGTGNTAQINLHSAAVPTNSSRLNLAITNALEARISSAISGAGTYLPLVLYTNNAEALRIATTGAITAPGSITATGNVGGATMLPTAGIQFPAVQNSIANVNTLDDYEEGTWTPSIGGTATYTVQIGKYTKIGDTVLIHLDLVVNVIGTGSTTTISGLPFAVGNTTAIGVGLFASSAIASVSMGLLLSAGLSSIQFSNLTAAATSMNNPSAVIGSSFLIRASFSYKI